MDLSTLQPVFQSQGLTPAQSAVIRAAVLDLLSNKAASDTLTRTLQLDPVELDTTIIDLPGGRESPEPTPPPTATTLARYDDLGLLGKGGMGEVRRIRDRELNRNWP